MKLDTLKKMIAEEYSAYSEQVGAPAGAAAPAANAVPKVNVAPGDVDAEELIREKCKRKDDDKNGTNPTRLRFFRNMFKQLKGGFKSL